MIASYLLDAGERNHNLDELALRYLESHHDQDRRADRHGASNQKRMDEVPRRRSRPTRPKTPTSPCGCASRWPRRLDELVSTRLFDELEVPLVEVLVELGVERHQDRHRRCSIA